MPQLAGCRMPHCSASLKSSRPISMRRISDVPVNGARRMEVGIRSAPQQGQRGLAACSQSAPRAPREATCNSVQAARPSPPTSPTGPPPAPTSQHNALPAPTKPCQPAPAPTVPTCPNLIELCIPQQPTSGIIVDVAVATKHLARPWAHMHALMRVCMCICTCVRVHVWYLCARACTHAMGACRCALRGLLSRFLD
jgi:hypothetical protein